jgi:formylmethanofuran dehydrogenase subunit A
MVDAIAMALALFGAQVQSGPAAPPAAPAAVAAAATAKESTGRVGEKIPPFVAKVLRGDKEGELDSAKQAKVTVYFLAGTTCAATTDYAERLAALVDVYGVKGVDFVFVYPNRNESAADKRKFHKEKRLGGAFLNDADGAIVKRLAAKRTGEALLCDKEGRVLYRGGIDDNLKDAGKVKSKYLAQAIDETLAGKAVSVTTGKVFGEIVKN